MNYTISTKNTCPFWGISLIGQMGRIRRMGQISQINRIRRIGRMGQIRQMSQICPIGPIRIIADKGSVGDHFNCHYGDDPSPLDAVHGEAL